MANNDRKVRSGLPMSEESLKEWERTFKEMEESIDELYSQEEARNPKSKYMRLQQQSFPDFV